jgi:hypothetical protein
MEANEFFRKILEILEEKESEAIDVALEEFRQERINDLENNRTLKEPFVEGPKLVIHLIPLASFQEPGEFDFARYAGKHNAIAPLRRTMGGQSFNFEGLLSFAPQGDGACFRYVQVYRNGIVECIDAHEFNSDKKLVYAETIEPDVFEGVNRFLAFQKEIGVKPPIVFCMSLLGVLGYKMPINHEDYLFNNVPANERNILLFPGVMVDKYLLTSEELKPTFDRLWNSFGYARSLSYDEKGIWKRK